MNKDYWKDAYQEQWEKAASKEKAIKGLIEEATGYDVVEVGLGAGSSSYVSGSARDNGLQKGDADLYVSDKECFIEVTGPNIKMDFSKPLWVRPDKVRNTQQKLKISKGKLHVVVHVLNQKDGETRIRVIVLNDLFFEHLDVKKTFPTVNPYIRGREETYLEIPSVHETLVTFDEFIELLKNI